MSAPPGTNTEYSRGSAPSGPVSEPLSGGGAGAESAPLRAARAVGRTVALGALLGAALIAFSQFVALYSVHAAGSSAPIKTVGTGANHAWAPLLIALLAVALAYAVDRHGNRAAVAALGVLGIVTLLIAVLVDLPDAHATGLVGSSSTRYVQATATPGTGLYLETLGAVVLLISGGVGLLIVAGRRDGASRVRRGDAAAAPAAAAAAEAAASAAAAAEGHRGRNPG